MTKLREQAVNPAQYDNPTMDWAAEGSAETPARKFIREFLEPELEKLRPQSMLDVGCGTAWLGRIATQFGCTRYVGIDPSANNVKMAHEFYPELEVIQMGAEQLETEETFDLVTYIVRLNDFSKMPNRPDLSWNHNNQ